MFFFFNEECTIIQLDVDMLDSYINGKRDPIMEETNNRPMTSLFRLVLNHWPLLSRNTRFVKPFINEVEPNLILKGDSHHVSLFVHDPNSCVNSFLFSARNFCSRSYQHDQSYYCTRISSNRSYLIRSS
jgi:hypothetical protein